MLTLERDERDSTIRLRIVHPRAEVAKAVRRDHTCLSHPESMGHTTLSHGWSYIVGPARCQNSPTSHEPHRLGAHATPHESAAVQCIGRGTISDPGNVLMLGHTNLRSR